MSVQLKLKSLEINLQQKQVFLVSLLFKKVRVRGGGRLFEGGAYLLFWPRGWALIRGRALIRAWALIRGNTV